MSKTPYLCGGDSAHPFYVLYDAIIVARPNGDVPLAAYRDVESVSVAADGGPGSSNKAE